MKRLYINGDVKVIEKETNKITCIIRLDRKQYMTYDDNKYRIHYPNGNKRDLDRKKFTVVF